MSTIEHLLTVAQKRLAELEGEAEHLRALIRLYVGPAHGQNVKQAGFASDAKGRSRRVSPAWKPLGAYLVTKRELHLDELTAFSERNALGFDRTQIRNQMHNWKRSGFVSSPGKSIFTVTPAGVDEMSDATPTHSNGADHKPAPLPDIEDRDEPRSDPARFDPSIFNKAPLPGGGT